MAADAQPPQRDHDDALLLALLSLSLVERARIAAFVAAGSRSAYEIELRRQLAHLGYGDIPAALRDPAIIRALESDAEAIATSVVDTVNAMLARRLLELPPGIDPQSATAQLQPFLDAINAYNRSTLVPYIVRSAQQQARDEFYRRNGIVTMWTIEPTSSTGKDDVCNEAIAASPMSSDEADRYDFPAHRNCPHMKVPVQVDRSTLPDSPWAG